MSVLTSQQAATDQIACGPPPDEADWSSAKLPPRRRARALALQAIFELDATRHRADAVLEALFNDSELNVAGQEFARDIVAGVSQQNKTLDAKIQQYAPAWPVDQLPLVDRSLLRLAVYELTISQNAAPKVVINEAVELAKLFGGESSPRFINGVLGSLHDAIYS